jgi:asparagine synthase (glutamine-hydrolysing)
MCGIAGVFASPAPPAALEAIGERMVEQLRHRGPDGRGVVVRRHPDGRNVLLAHSRLSINDLTLSGAQPMALADGSLWVVFNGEIYNFLELRAELEQSGHSFRSRCDTEVILAAWRKWGLKSFDRFIGMWAIALWDERDGTFLLSRDRLGVKPLYFARIADTFIFGSEPKVILEQMDETPRLNLRALSDYFSYRQALAGDTFFEGIESLEPGTCLLIRGGREVIHRYWDLPIVHERYDPGEVVVRQETARLLDSAVALRLVADVPVGAFLSGGLDSSALVAIMARHTSAKVKSFTIGFAEKEFNEFEFAEEVARHFETEHHENLLDPDRYFDDMDELIRIKDAPLAVPNEIALHVLSRILKQHVTVVLSGEGADELFGGYGRIFRSAGDYLKVAAAGGLAGLDTATRTNLTEKYGASAWRSPVDHFLDQYSYMPFAAKSQLLSPEVFGALGQDPHHRSLFESMFSRLEGLDLHDKYMWVFQKLHLQGLLGRLDAATMSASVEGRVPFVDHRLVEYISALPLHYKMRWRNDVAQQNAHTLNSSQVSERYDTTKYLLRELMRHSLPSRVLARHKVGFPVPLGNWLTGPLRTRARERLLSPDARSRPLFRVEAMQEFINGSDHSPANGLRVWMLLNVEAWMNAYGVTV